ncbi:hypothetical protein [Micromonospora sp. NPDC049662]|uniref:hypothetical protein n=1 Tax=Micromonospora sp. NPDC049662 TaxID=3155397 RepID=UPI00343C8545
MGYVIIRPTADADEYVIWCTSSDQPVAVGNRVEIAADAAAIEPDRDDIDARLDHADLHGSSMIPYPFGWWDDDGFLYQQRGILPRNRLAEAAHLLATGRDAEVWALLQPFEDSEKERDA